MVSCLRRLESLSALLCERWILHDYWEYNNEYLLLICLGINRERKNITLYLVATIEAAHTLKLLVHVIMEAMPWFRWFVGDLLPWRTGYKHANLFFFCFLFLPFMQTPSPHTYLYFVIGNIFKCYSLNLDSEFRGIIHVLLEVKHVSSLLFSLFLLSCTWHFNSGHCALCGL